MLMTFRPWELLAILCLSLLLDGAAADCECGYSSTVSSATYHFTDLLESDFLHLANISKDTDWQRQVFNVSSAAARGDYGESAELRNIILNPLLNNTAYTGPGVLDGDIGLQLLVRGGIPVDGMVSVAEIDSSRTDMFWGSYRASLKLTALPGTCAAFFWYFNDTQEIDMEFLSSQFVVETNSFPVHLVLQSAQSAKQGFVGPSTGNHIVANLPFNPTLGFHEYRIDFVPDRIVFYADSKIIATMKSSAAPTAPGHLILTHWSNGNGQWSGGPPVADATMAVSYVRAYFNSSLSSRQQDFSTRCSNPSLPKAVCPIPDQVSTLNDGGQTGHNDQVPPFFFSKQFNMTNNQTVYQDSQAAQIVPRGLPVSISLIVLLLVSLAIKY